MALHPRHLRVDRLTLDVALVRALEAPAVLEARERRRCAALACICRVVVRVDEHVDVVIRAFLRLCVHLRGRALQLHVPQRMQCAGGPRPRPVVGLVGDRQNGVAGRLLQLFRRAMAEQTLAKAYQAPPPPLWPVEVLLRRELRRALCALLPRAPAEEPDDNEEDECTPKRHEQDLPPLQPASLCNDDRDRVRYARDRRHGRGARWRGHELRETYAEAGDHVCRVGAVGLHARAAAQYRGRARARKTVAGPGARAARTSCVTSLARVGACVKELGLRTRRETAPARENGKPGRACRALVERWPRAGGTVWMAVDTLAARGESIRGTA